MLDIPREGFVDAVAGEETPCIPRERMDCVARRWTWRVSRSRKRLAAGLRKIAALTFTAAFMLVATGCHHRRRQAYAPPAPPLRSDSSHHRTYSSSQRSQTYASRSPRGPITEPPQGKPILVETGLASWYGPSGRRTADGSAYDGTGMTAAHKTLPLGTVARVTNLVNGEDVMVRITDRGPFAHGRILDLSESAAKKIDLYRMGVAKVKVEAFANSAATPAGRWCVQVGAFKKERGALDLKSALLKRYAGSRVIEFPGDTGYWVRIDPLRHDHADAAAIKEWIGNPDSLAVAYLVRVD